MRGSWRPSRTATYWPPLLRPSAILFRSPVLLNRRPGVPTLFAGFFYRILLPTGLVSKLTDFLSSPSYIIVQSPTQYLLNGMFDRHQAEITVMQFRGHSLPVHLSMTVPWDFTLSHIVSQARLRDFFPLLANGMCHFRCHWNGMFGRVEGQYTTIARHADKLSNFFLLLVKGLP